MLPMIQIGPVALQAAGLVLILGFWLSLEVAGRQGTRLGLDGGAIQSAGFLGAIAGIIGARLTYVVQYWPVYQDNLLEIVALNPQTLSPIAGITIGLLVAAIYLRRKEMPVRPLLDAIAPGAGVFLVSLALANLASGNAFGTETTVPWAIELWAARRHPVQGYEIAAGLAILAILFRVGDRVPASGLRFLLFVALYGGARVLLEPLRATSQLMPGGLRVVQVAGLAVLVIAMGLMRAWSEIGEETSMEPVAIEEAQL